jgi:hypothetical protein
MCRCCRPGGRCDHDLVRLRDRREREDDRCARRAVIATLVSSSACSGGPYELEHPVRNGLQRTPGSGRTRRAPGRPLSIRQKRCGMRRVSLLLALTLLACLAVFFTAGAAQAHDTCTHHGNDFGCVSGTHHELFSICDYEGDGRWAYIEVDVWYYGNIFLYDNNSPWLQCQGLQQPSLVISRVRRRPRWRGFVH